jgi:plastocyanin
MSIWGRRVPVKLVAAVAASMVIAALLPVMTRSAEREVTLVARGMTFYLESDPRTPNPTLTFTAGETVRIVLKNQDRGMTHDFAAPALDAGLGSLNWNEEVSTTVDVPSEPGTYEYFCNPHRLMMRGTITVVP